MKNIELIAIRTFLNLSVSNAVEIYNDANDKKITTRAWQKWESGENPVPENVEHLVDTLAETREELKGDEENPVRFYRTFEAYKREEKAGNKIDDLIRWRLMQSVFNEILYTGLYSETS